MHETKMTFYTVVTKIEKTDSPGAECTLVGCAASSDDLPYCEARNIRASVQLHMPLSMTQRVRLGGRVRVTVESLPDDDADQTG